MCKLFAYKDDKIKIAAIKALVNIGKKGDALILQTLNQELLNTNKNVRKAAARAIQKLKVK